MTPFHKISLKTRLTFSFLILSTLMIASLGVAILKIQQVDKAVDNIVSQSIPVAFSEGQLASDINGTLAALKGWLLTNNPEYKTQRATLWKNISSEIQILDKFLKGQPSWHALKKDLNDFQAAQTKTETIAHSEEDLPATKLLNQNVTPLTDSMLYNISQAYIEEVTQEATPKRKQMLADMGDIRSALAVVTGNIRAYLLTGEKHYADQYQSVWSWAQGKLTHLRTEDRNLTNDQLNYIKEFSNAAKKVTPLFSQLISLRTGENWNQSRALLIHEVLPLSNSILKQLTQPKTGFVAQKRLEMENAGNHAVDVTNNLTKTAYFLAFTGAVLAVILVILSIKTIVTPVRHMTDTMTILADGKNDVDIPGIHRRDEIGEMAQALQVFQRNSQERLRLETEQNQEQKARAERAKRIEDLSLTFDQNMRDVLTQTADATTRMRVSASAMRTAAQSTLEQTRTASEASLQTQSNVQHVASATNQLSSSLSQISQNTLSSVEAINEAIEKGENASNTVNWMSEASARIGEVINMIEDIAAQTNLLALNATIEAARAGETGKGFAVVAGEVKNLANQTARATQEISQHIARMRDTTSQSVSAIHEVCENISRVRNQASDVRDTVSQQSIATQNISENVGHVTQNTDVIADNIQQVEAAATQTNEAAGDVQEAANDVSQQADALNKQVESFLNALKSA